MASGFHPPTPQPLPQTGWPLKSALNTLWQDMEKFHSSSAAQTNRSYQVIRHSHDLLQRLSNASSYTAQQQKILMKKIGELLTIAQSTCKTYNDVQEMVTDVNARSQNQIAQKLEDSLASSIDRAQARIFQQHMVALESHTQSSHTLLCHKIELFLSDHHEKLEALHHRIENLLAHIQEERRSPALPMSLQQVTMADLLKDLETCVKRDRRVNSLQSRKDVVACADEACESTANLPACTYNLRSRKAKRTA